MSWKNVKLGRSFTEVVSLHPGQRLYFNLVVFSSSLAIALMPEHTLWEGQYSYKSRSRRETTHPGVPGSTQHWCMHILSQVVSVSLHASPLTAYNESNRCLSVTPVCTRGGTVGTRSILMQPPFCWSTLPPLPSLRLQLFNSSISITLELTHILLDSQSLYNHCYLYISRTHQAVLCVLIWIKW